MVATMWAPFSAAKSGKGVDIMDRSNPSDIIHAKEDSVAVQKPNHQLSPPPPTQVDMQAHVGLRGVAAVWIVVFHCLGDPKYHSGWVVALQGSSLMPLFFMLSGFSLTVTYGRTMWASSSSSCLSCFSRRRQPDINKSIAKDVVHTDIELVEEGKRLSSRPVGCSSQPSPSPASKRPPSPSSFSARSLPPFDTRAFYQNRIARVMPVYWLSILVSIPLWLLNIGDFPFALQTFLPSLASSVIPVTTLFSFLTGSYLAAINPVGWFITTLVFFWFFFPYWLPTMQRLSDRALVNTVTWGFWLQLLLIQGIYSLMPLITDIRPFGTATTNPLSRFPLFLMGMAAGVLTLRYPVVGGGRVGRTADRDEHSSSSGSSSSSRCSRSVEGKKEDCLPRHTNSKQLQMRILNGAGAATEGGGVLGEGGREGGVKEDESTVEVIAVEEMEEQGANASMPWPACIFGLPLPVCLTSRRNSSSASCTTTTVPTAAKMAFFIPPHSPRTQSEWARLATQQSLALLFLTLLISGIDTGVRVLSQGQHTISAQVWFQGLVAMTQLNVFLALTRDGNLSLASRFLRLPFCKWIGRISMNIYLIHYPLLGYLALGLHFPQSKDLLNCYNLGSGGVEDMTEREALRVTECQTLIKDVRELPWWSVFVILPLAALLGEALARWVEEPARRALRHRKG